MPKLPKIAELLISRLLRCGNAGSDISRDAEAIDPAT
jgi:hypothetical protein